MIRCLGIMVLFLLVGACSPQSVEKKKSISNGKQLYRQKCQSCHKANGQGFKKLYPPITKAYLRQNRQRIPCIIQNGMNETLTVRDTVYNMAMPANPDLDHAEIAQIMTFIYHKYGGGVEKAFTADTIRTLLKNSCKGH